MLIKTTISAAHDVQSVALVGFEERGDSFRLVDGQLEGSIEILNAVRMSNIHSIRIISEILDEYGGDATENALAFTVIADTIEYYYNFTSKDWEQVTVVGETTPYSKIKDVPLDDLIIGSQEIAVKVYYTADASYPKTNMIEEISITGALILDDEQELYRCQVYGYIEGIDGSPVEGAVVSFSMKGVKDKYVEWNKKTILNDIQVETDSNGYWCAQVIPSDQFEGVAEQPYLVTITNGRDKVSKNGNQKIEVVVPSIQQVKFADLITRSSS